VTAKWHLLHLDTFGRMNTGRKALLNTRFLLKILLFQGASCAIDPTRLILVVQRGKGIENRKKPPLPADPNDVFDRQRVIPGFDQGLIERQSCLVLGVGGIGQNVALTLARLGVGRIVLVDCDVYEISNLTRQCLGSPSQVGRGKVDVALESLSQSHNLRSSIEGHHIDAL
jgi:hypothetical protein